jgi:hypothetical protein
MKMAVVWDTAPYSLVEADRRFIALMMEAVHPSETSVYFNDIKRRYIPENCYLQSITVFRMRTEISDETE